MELDWGSAVTILAQAQVKKEIEKKKATPVVKKKIEKTKATLRKR